MYMNFSLNNRNGTVTNFSVIHSAPSWGHTDSRIIKSIYGVVYVCIYIYSSGVLNVINITRTKKRSGSHVPDTAKRNSKQYFVYARVKKKTSTPIRAAGFLVGVAAYYDTVDERNTDEKKTARTRYRPRAYHFTSYTLEVDDGPTRRKCRPRRRSRHGAPNLVHETNKYRK